MPSSDSIYHPPLPSGPHPKIASEYELRKHFQGSMSLKHMHVGKFSGKHTIYPNAQTKQGELIGVLVNNALQVALEEFLLRPDGVTAGQIAALAVLKSPSGKLMGEAEIRTRMLELYAGDKRQARIPFNEDSAKEFVRTLKNNGQLKNSDDLASPEQLETYARELELYNSRQRHYVQLSAESGGTHYKPPKRPEHPYIKAFHRFAELTEFADVAENGVKDFKVAQAKQDKRGKAPWDMHDINRATFIPKTIRAYLRFSEVMKENISREMGGNYWAERPMQMQPAGYHGAKILIPLSKGFAPNAKYPATASLAEVIIMEPSQYDAYRQSHPIYETIRAAREKSVEGERKKVQFNAEIMSIQDEARLEAEYMEHVNHFRRLNHLLRKEKRRSETPQHVRENNSYFALIDKIKEENLQFHGTEQVEARLAELLKLHQSIHAVGASRATPEWRKLYIYHALEYNHRHGKDPDNPPIPTDMIMDIDPKMYHELSASIQSNRQARMRSRGRGQ